MAQLMFLELDVKLQVFRLAFLELCRARGRTNRATLISTLQSLKSNGIAQSIKEAGYNLKTLFQFPAEEIYFSLLKVRPAVGPPSLLLSW